MSEQSVESFERQDETATDPTSIRQQSSMRYWFPRLESTGVPVPQTEWITLRTWDEATSISEGVPLPDTDDFCDAVEAVGGPPAFIRTDQASDKHSMASASRVTSLDEDHLKDHAFKVGRHNNMAGFVGLPFTHLAIREWLDLKEYFTAFEHTPIAPEVRVFLYEGEIESIGFYWPEDAIEHHSRHNGGGGLVDDWKVRLQTARHEAFGQSQSRIVESMAETVADVFTDGYWSVDFALTESDEWYCIDMARGEASWHPDGCVKPEAIRDD